MKSLRWSGVIWISLGALKQHSNMPRMDHSFLDDDFAEEGNDDFPVHFLYSINFDEEGIEITADEADYLRQALMEF